MNSKLWLSSLIFGCLSMPPIAGAFTNVDNFSGIVVGVSDGDTISVMHGGRPEKIRLVDIDCPEKKQAFGQRAKQYTSQMTFQKHVNVRVTGTDLYGRTLGEVFLPDRRSLNTSLLQQGLAWVYLHRSKDPLKKQAESQAQTAHRGLWSDKTPVPPWEYRRNIREQQQRDRERQTVTLVF